MSNLPYKNPISPLQVYGSSTVDRSKTFGTNFSVLGTGGFMEVYSLSDLNYIIPIGETGNIEFSGNTIPVQFKKGTGSVFSPDVLTLNSDNISSGRRRLGMLVYVYETNKIYQHSISNYDNLWSAATGSTGPGGNTVVISDFGTTVKNNTIAGQNFINSWTASTIEGVDGYTNLDATWRELKTGGGSTSGDYLPLSGGTVTGNTIFQSGLTANTISATTYYNLPIDPDTFVTGLTLSSNTITLTQNRTDQYSSFTISLSAYTGVTSVTASSGLSGNTTTGNITLINTAPDKTVVITGGTNIQVISNYPNFGINFTGTTSSSGEYLPLSGGTVTGNTIFQSGLTSNTISATTYFNLPKDIFVTGGTYSSGSATFTNNTGGTFNVSGFSTTTPFTGGTVSGATNFTNGLTANTISATTYQNLPIDIYTTGFTFNTGNYDLTIKRNGGLPDLTQSLSILASDLTITGGTYNSNTGVATFTNNTGGTFTVSGFLTGYTDTVITAFTYNNNTFTIKDSSGSTFNSNFNTVTGLTVNGDLTVTGNTSLKGLTATTISATTYQNLPNNVTGYYLPLSGGTVTGGTVFNSGLTANTISATTYYNLPTDIRVTGGTYTSGSATFTNNTGGTFTVTGFYTGATDVFTTGATYSNNIFTFTNNTGGTFNVLFNTLTGLTINGNLTVTGNTSLQALTATTISATTYNNLPDNITGKYLPLSGGTVSGATNFTNGLTANTISATTYFNLPTDIRVTGGTYSTGTATFTNNTGGTFTVTGFYTGSTDIRTTGATYSNNTFTFTNNTGGTYSVLFNTLTGLTINGNLTVTGNTSLQALTSTTISATTYNNLPNTLYSGDGTLSGNRVVNIGTNTLNFSSSTYPNNLVLSGGNVGINTTGITNALTVSASTDPIRVEGIQTSTDTELLTIDGSGVVHKSSIPFLRNETHSGATDIITINQSIFNPADLTVLTTSVFIIETNANYYILGDFYNSGSTIVNGTLKVGGVIYNSGTITGPGIIE